ncbi:MAG: molecular chaperone GrpE [Bacteroidetes bacterium]|nr:MAG: molecular chaperone GrpE [Bacteroidota bacterium]
MSQKDKDLINETGENLAGNDEPVSENKNPETATDSTATDDAQKAEMMEQKLAEMNDKYLRLYSDFDNFRKRNAKERIDLLKNAGEEIIKSLLPVIDDLERAVRSNETATDIAAVNEGVKLVHQKFRHILSQKGLEAMESVGAAFDTDKHEAITNIPAPTEDLKGKVVDEVEKGYTLNGKVIRFAKVVVGN